MSDFRKKILALFIIVVLDSISTIYFITKGWATEWNPVVEWYIHMTDVTSMGISKILMAMLFLMFMRRIDLSQNKSIETILTFGIIGYIIIYISLTLAQFLGAIP